MRVLIAGCGYVGAALARELLEEGHEVFGLKRTATGLPAGVVPVIADLARPETLGAIPDGLEAVVLAAAADATSPASYRAIYVDGTANLLAALSPARQPRLRRLVFCSSTGVYGQSQGEWVDESSATVPEGFTGAVMLEAERTLERAACPTVIARLGGIYGPGRTRLVDEVRAGKAELWPGPPLYTNRIHRDDCAGLLAHLLRLPEPERLYLGVDAEPAARNDVLAWLAERLGVPAPEMTQSVPERRRGGSKRCSSHRLVASGYRLRYPSFREGYGALIG